MKHNVKHITCSCHCDEVAALTIRCAELEAALAEHEKAGEKYREMLAKAMNDFTDLEQVLARRVLKALGTVYENTWECNREIDLDGAIAEVLAALSPTGQPTVAAPSREVAPYAPTCPNQRRHRVNVSNDCACGGIGHPQPTQMGLTRFGSWQCPCCRFELLPGQPLREPKDASREGEE